MESEDWVLSGDCTLPCGIALLGTDNSNCGRSPLYTAVSFTRSIDAFASLVPHSHPSCSSHAHTIIASDSKYRGSASAWSPSVSLVVSYNFARLQRPCDMSK